MLGIAGAGLWFVIRLAAGGRLLHVVRLARILLIGAVLLLTGRGLRDWLFRRLAGLIAVGLVGVLFFIGLSRAAAVVAGLLAGRLLFLFIFVFGILAVRRHRLRICLR